MKITRKEALNLSDLLLETIVLDGYQYWVKFKHHDIPFDVAFKVIREFIEQPSLSEIEIPTDKYR
jgi:hypothetical protein